MAASPHPLRRLLASASSLMLTRAEFASLELAQARGQVVRWLVLALAIAVLALMTLLVLSALLVVVLWDALGWVTLAVLLALYGGLAAWGLLTLRREVSQAPPVLDETLRELRNDREALMAGLGRRDGDAADPEGDTP